MTKKKTEPPERTPVKRIKKRQRRYKTTLDKYDKGGANVVSPSHPGQSLAGMLQGKQPTYISINQIKPYTEKLKESIKSPEEFVGLLNKLIENDTDLSIASSAIFWYFESNYPLHMYDATTVKHENITREIIESLIIPNLKTNATNLENLKRYAQVYKSDTAQKALVRFLDVLKRE